MSLTIDHVCLVSPDAVATARALRDTWGLASYDGGRFPGRGIGMRVVPLDPGVSDHYIEIESVIDPVEASASPMGRWLGGLAISDALVGWTIRTDTRAELEGIAGRLSLPVFEVGVTWQLRVLPDGSFLRLSGVGDTLDLWPMGLPNFIHWDNMADHPARHPAPAHRGLPQSPRIGWLETAGGDELRDWIGAEACSMPLRIVPGSGGIRAVGIVSDHREFELRREATLLPGR